MKDVYHREGSRGASFGSADAMCRSPWLEYAPVILERMQGNLKKTSTRTKGKYWTFRNRTNVFSVAFLIRKPTRWERRSSCGNCSCTLWHFVWFVRKTADILNEWHDSGMGEYLLVGIKSLHGLRETQWWGKTSVKALKWKGAKATHRKREVSLSSDQV